MLIFGVRVFCRHRPGDLVTSTPGADNRRMSLRFALTRPLRYAALVAGAVPVLCFPGAGLAALAWVCLVPGLLLMQRAPSAREAAVRGWWFGAGFILTAMYWLIPSIGPALPVLAVLFGALQAGVGFAHGAGLERAGAGQVPDRQAGGDHEHPRPRLRDEARGVDLQGSEAVALIGQGPAQGGEVGAAVRGQQADDVLDDDGVGAAALGAQRLHQLPEAEKGRGAAALQACPCAGQTEVLAGTGGPGQIGLAGQVGGGDLPDVAFVEVRRRVRVVVAIGRGLDRIEVVGEGAGPGLAQAEAGHAAAGEELVEDGRGVPIHRSGV